MLPLAFWAEEVHAQPTSSRRQCHVSLSSEGQAHLITLENMSYLPLLCRWVDMLAGDMNIKTAAVIATTVHAQDIPDMKGDQARQGKTLPLLYGERVARWSLAVLVVLWSVILPVSCNVQAPIARWLPLGVGSSISVLTTWYHHERSDKLVWNLWCFWLAGLYLLPLFRQVP